MVVRLHRRPRARDGDAATVDTDREIGAVLDVLDDADCRAILAATSDDALSATELAETCDLPLSTTYRKLDLLTEQGFLAERTRLRHSGKHASEYVAVLASVVFSLSPDGETELRVTRRDPDEGHVGPGPSSPAME